MRCRRHCHTVLALRRLVCLLVMIPAAMAATAPPAAAQCTLRWTQVAESHWLPTRPDWKLAYDSARDVMVAFGSSHIALAPGQTWERSGGRWMQRSTDGPAASADDRMVYDAHRGRTVLYGGDTLRRIWEWDGAQWTAVTPPTGQPSPGYRARHGMAYDADRRVTVLFGGRGPSQYEVHNDLWEWDGQRWTLRSAGGPSADHPQPRDWCQLTYDTHRRRVVLCGGRAGLMGELFTDTWEWDGAAWTRLATDAPIPTAMAYSPSRARTVVYTVGDGSPLSSELWEWDGVKWMPVHAGDPFYRPNPALEFDPERGAMLLLGGGGSSGNHEAWWIDGATWTHAVASPTARTTSIAYDAARGVTVLHGGGDGEVLSDVWEFDGQSWVAEPGGDWIAQRIGHSLVYYPSLAEVISFGGLHFAFRTGVFETFGWNGHTWRHITGSSALFPRTWAGAALDQHRGRIVSFGGLDLGGYPRADTIEWSGEHWTAIPTTTAPSHRYGHALAYDPTSQRTILFGGYSQAFDGQTWSWDSGAAQWTLLAETGPSPRLGAAMLHHPARNRLILFGGRTAGGPVNDLWEWTGAQWQQFHTVGPAPSPRGAAAATYDAARHALILFGGTTGSIAQARGPFLGDTWLLHPAADWNADGMTNSSDIASFLTSWINSVTATDLDADFDHSRVTDSADIGAFLQDWLSAISGGCG